MHSLCTLPRLRPDTLCSGRQRQSRQTAVPECIRVSVPTRASPCLPRGLALHAHRDAHPGGADARMCACAARGKQYSRAHVLACWHLNTPAARKWAWQLRAQDSHAVDDAQEQPEERGTQYPQSHQPHSAEHRPHGDFRLLGISFPALPRVRAPGSAPAAWACRPQRGGRGCIPNAAAEYGRQRWRAAAPHRGTNQSAATAQRCRLERMTRPYARHPHGACCHEHTALHGGTRCTNSVRVSTLKRRGR